MLQESRPRRNGLGRDSVRLTLPLPPSVNAYWRIFRNRILLSAIARAYKLKAASVASRYGVQPLDGDVSVSLAVYRAQRRGDLDNFFKATFDALKGVAFNDDSQVVEIHAWRNDDKENPRVDVEVTPAVRWRTFEVEVDANRPLDEVWMADAKGKK